MTPSDAFREIVYRHICRAATNGVFSAAMTDTADVLGCTRDKVKTAIRALVKNGALTVETRGAGRLPSEYRIAGSSQTPTAPPPRRYGVTRVAVFNYGTKIAVDGEFAARVGDVAVACGITAKQAKDALQLLQRDGVLKQTYRGTVAGPSRYQIIGSPYDNAAEPAVPPPSRAFRATFREPLRERPVDRVRLVPPETFKANNFSMLGGRVR
jgi:hypothetical protein